MLICKRSHFFRENPRLSAFMLLVWLACLSGPTRAVIIEGNIKGVITTAYIDGAIPDTPFSNLAANGQSISAEFWYEFDENNFHPTSSSDSHLTYQFALSDMGIIFHLGSETFSTLTPSTDMPLTHYINDVSIARTPQFSYFDFFTSTKYSNDAFSSEDQRTTIAFNTESMSYFSGLDLIQNLTLTPQDNLLLGTFELAHFGHHGDEAYGIMLYGEFNEFTIGVRDPAVVDEPSSIGLVMIALLLLGFRYRMNRLVQQECDTGSYYRKLFE